MLHAHKRTTSGIAALALALATAAPAAGMPNTLDEFGPAGANAQPPAQAAIHHNSGSGSDWGYLAAGGAATSLILIGIGGTVAGRRQRRARKPAVIA
ncbi:MAG TPA: hypothetical protein VEF89_06210 [Solirubrobacteraceae bacterium]|nr:hypothetical protein [Solirubrobacteraceae bacterium]